MSPAFRIVLDTNILLRGVLNIHSAAGRVVQACDRRSVVLLFSKPVVGEYREIMTHATIVERYPELTFEKVELVLRRLRYVADIVRPARAHLGFPRDPADEKFIELAIAGRATHIVTADMDLLALASGHSEPDKAFRRRAPRTRVVEPKSILYEIEAQIGF